MVKVRICQVYPFNNVSFFPVSFLEFLVMSTATRIPARPAAAVPARPAAVPAQGKANPAVAAAAPVVAPVVEQPQTAAPTETAAPVVETAAPVAKKRGRKPGSAGQGGAKKKVDYHGLYVYDAAGAPVMVDDGSGNMIPQRQKLSAVPTDFNSGAHNKLRPNDFTDEAIFCDFNAQRLLAMSQGWEKKAKKIRALGGAADKKSALKFLKMREQLAKLREQLAAQGMDSALLDGTDEEPATE